MTSYLDQNKGILINFEPVDGAVLTFNVVMEYNQTREFWWWYWGSTAAQVDGNLSTLGAWVFDIKSYLASGARYFISVLRKR